MKDLLIEIGCEDLPARYVVPLAQALSNGVAAGVGKRGVPIGAQKTFATPRRIALLIADVADRQPIQNVERKGPQIAAAFKDGKPTPAALGFARSCGVPFDELLQEGGNLVFRKQQPGKPTIELLPEIFEETLKSMDELVPKRMRWGSGDETFVRPVQWLLALLGDDVIPLRRFGLDAGRVTYGHRFHAPEAIALKTPTDYEASLKTAKVWADFASRREEIEKQIKAEAATLGGTAKIDGALLDEVTALVEWPVVISGRIEERFLELPPEVIVATVETNQRYFTLFDSAGKLLPSFITISNIESKDVAQVIRGNERVVRPRLTDALFFWQQDREHGLCSNLPKLASTTYQKDLGSLEKKVQRIDEIAIDISTRLAVGGSLPENLRAVISQVANRCKLDLFSKTVYEFPELQGIAGGYLASSDGMPENVVTAIREHYLPTQQGTEIPSTLEGRIVALADKLDTLAGIFAIGQKPTASKDPFALRRAALGILRILIEGKLELDLGALLKSALDAQPAGKRDAAMLAELTDFVFERLRGYYSEQQLPVEMFEAVRILAITAPIDFNARVMALRDFWSLPEAKNLAAAHKRVRNILRQAADVPSVDVWDYLKRRGTEADNALIVATERIKDQYALAPLPKNYAELEANYRQAFNLLASLRKPVDAFFEQKAKVLDADPGLREGRVTLLRSLDELFREVADISCLPG